MMRRFSACIVALLTVCALSTPVAAAEGLEVFRDGIPQIGADVETADGIEAAAEDGPEVSAPEDGGEGNPGLYAPAFEPEVEELEALELAPDLPEAEAPEDDGLPRGVAAVPADGQCGDSATWSLSADGVMTVSGTGRMWDFRNDADWFDYHECPWEDRRQDIARVTFGEGVTYVGADAFSSCTNLTQVDFADSITEIGCFAFCWDERLGNFTLPPRLESIGQAAFCQTAITAIDIPGSVGFLDAGVCEGCEKLTSVIFRARGEGGYVMGNIPFRDCHALERIDVEEGHLYLHAFDGALYNGDILMQYPPGRRDAAYRVEEGCRQIFQNAFERATRLETLWLPRTLGEISDYAFVGCGALRSVTYEGNEAWWNQVRIGEENGALLAAPLSFENHLPKTSGKCGKSATWSIDGDGVLTISGTGRMWDFQDDSDGYDYHECPWSEWVDKGIRKVVVGKGITCVGASAFYDCAALESVSLSNTVEELGNFAFYCCTALKRIALPRSLKKAGQQALGNTGLTAIEIPGTLTDIGFGLCENCSQLTSVRFLAKDSSASMWLGDHPFRWCPALREIQVEAGHAALHMYGGALYQGNRLVQYPNGSKRESCRVEAGCTTISSLAFESAEALKSVTLPNTLSNIYWGAFRWCEHLKKVEYEGTRKEWKDIYIDSDNEPLTGASITFLKAPAPTAKPDEAPASGEYRSRTAAYRLNADGTATYLKPLKSAKSAAIPATVQANGRTYRVTAIADKAFYRDEKLERVTIGKNVKTIGKRAFQGCAKLKKATGGAGVTTIKASAFQGCRALPAITLCAKVKTVGAGAFQGCAKLKTITLKTTNLTGRSVGGRAFRGVGAKATFKCPAKKLASYKALLPKKGAPKTATYR